MNSNRKAQASIEFLVAFSIVVMLFLIFAVIMYQKTIQANEIKADMAGQRVANSLAEAINSVYIAGEGFSQIITLPEKISLSSYEVKFYLDEPTVFISTETQSWSAPLVTPYINVSIDEGCSVYQTLTLGINSTTEITVTRNEDNVFLETEAGSRTQTISGDMVYCDKSGRMWSASFPATYSWGPVNTEPDNECVHDNPNYGACYACDTLYYAGFNDWKLPSCNISSYSEIPDNLSTKCSLYQLGMEICGWNGESGGQPTCIPAWDPNAFDAFYWSSTQRYEYPSSTAWAVSFSNGLFIHYMKESSLRVRCVRTI